VSKRKIIDAHVHLYDCEQNRHEFLETEDETFRALVGDYSSLPRKYSLTDYVEDAQDLEIAGLVWNEFLSADPVKEVLWAQRLSETLPFPIALVGLVNFLAADLERTLDIYSHCSNVAAVREHLGWDERNRSRRFAKRPDLLRDSRWLQGLKTLAMYRFKCSLEVFAPQLPDLLTAVRLNPGIQFSIAVMGWPLDIDMSGFAHWKRLLEPLSKCANVHIVISAIESAIECVFGMDWSIAKVQPWIDTIFELFGASRIMFGSHRPICKLSSTFPEPYRAYEVLTDAVSDSEQDAVFRKNAAAWFFNT
jgi:predicted TIM-barrel fold metal-dependent hydrolase